MSGFTAVAGSLFRSCVRGKVPPPVDQPSVTAHWSYKCCLRRVLAGFLDDETRKRITQRYASMFFLRICAL